MTLVRIQSSNPELYAQYETLVSKLPGARATLHQSGKMLMARSVQLKRTDMPASLILCSYVEKCALGLYRLDSLLLPARWDSMTDDNFADIIVASTRLCDSIGGMGAWTLAYTSGLVSLSSDIETPFDGLSN